MGKYTSYTQKELPPKGETHEIWSGFGCIIMLIIPVISYAAGVLTVEWIVGNNWRLFPREWLGTPRMPDIVYRSDGLSALLLWLTDIKNLYAYLIVGLIYMLLISGLISAIYAAVYGAIGPKRYGPLDAPPPKIKVIKKSR
jgi:hypothetical protein